MGVIGYFMGLIVMTLVLAVGQIAGAIVFGMVLGEGPSGPSAMTTQAIALACGTDRRIIRIYGTDSTGEFSPIELVRSLDPTQPPIEIFAGELQNPDFNALLTGATEGCVLTFSYDDIYLAENGAAQRGVNAWNHSTSPWNIKPDVLADRLQRLMNDYPESVTFDLVAYSAGGVVPAYWAAREQTTDAARERVHSIVVVDGIVSGVDLELSALACTIPGLQQAEIATYGRFPCQLNATSSFTTAVRTGDWWTKVRLATVRARGDLIVWHRFAGLHGRAVRDPAIVAKLCDPGDWLGTLAECVLRTHGSVLGDGTAIETMAEVIALPP
jgi:hypothetical protein